MNKVLDLIGREKELFENDICTYSKELSHIVSSSTFLVIGGAGSIGQTVTKEIFKRNPKKLHVVDIRENNMVELVRDIRSSFGYIEGDFPPFELDGELWSKRGDFEKIVSIVKKKEPHDGWKDLTYNIFDVPSANGGLMQRLSKLEYYLKLNHIESIRIIKQLPCKDEVHLKSFLKEVEKMGGEGVVVRNPESKYATKRDSNVLKVKSFYDAECKVIAHNQGDGKNKNLLGSLTCKDEKGMTFDVGSGFSDTQRKNPPAIGEKITYKYQEITKGGKPRFPIFLRIKEEI